MQKGGGVEQPFFVSQLRGSCLLKQIKFQKRDFTNLENAGFCVLFQKYFRTKMTGFKLLFWKSIFWWFSCVGVIQRESEILCMGLAEQAEQCNLFIFSFSGSDKKIGKKLLMLRGWLCHSILFMPKDTRQGKYSFLSYSFSFSLSLSLSHTHTH